VQEFLLKYGLAAHLALVAVAPLFLFGFSIPSDAAGALLAISLIAAVWVLIAPTRLKGEMPSDARMRVAKGIVRDPLFWILFLSVLYYGVSWLNTGIDLAYNAETTEWYLAPPAVLFLPASVSGCGALPAAASVAMLVTITGIRQALGRSSRATFLYGLALFAGIAAFLDLALFAADVARARDAVACSWTTASFAGIGFALPFFAGICSLELFFESRQRRRIFLNAFAVGACAAGLLFFAPLELALPFLLAGLVLIVLAAVRLAVVGSANEAFKYLSALTLAALVPVLSVVWLASDDLIAARIALFSRGGYFPENWTEIRDILSNLAHTTWGASPWLGGGTGTFPLNLRFEASQMDWAVLPSDQATTYNGWWQILAENGIVGLLLMLIVPLFLLFTWVHRLCARSFGRRMSVLAVILGPVALALVVAEAFASASVLFPVIFILMCDLLAVAGKAIPLASPSATVTTKNTIES